VICKHFIDCYFTSQAGSYIAVSKIDNVKRIYSYRALRRYCRM